MFNTTQYTPVIDQTDNGPKATVTYDNTPSDYSSIDTRLLSYRNWPKTEVLKRSLASAGFVYTGQEDVVICPFCQVEGYHWETTDNPMEDHQSWSPNCPFLGNTPQTDSTQSISGNLDTCGLYGIEVVPNSIPVDLQRLGVTKSKGPLHPERITIDSRVETFRTWPKAIKQRAEQLAEAGFFYTGTSDQTLCFYCGGGLKDWVEKDDPWEQHALWFSKCAYVNLKKGPEFIAKVKKQNQPQPYSAGNTSSETKEPVAPADVLSEKCEKISLCEGQTVEQTLCKICYKNELGVVFLPCGHIVACVDCAAALKTCAVCRKPLEASVRAFLS